MTDNSKKQYIMLDSVYRTLCKWDLRNASHDNPASALVFIFFLKYISDNKKALGLNFKEIYEFDYISLLYGEKMHHEDITGLISEVETQLNIHGSILSSFVRDLELLELEKEFSQILCTVKDTGINTNNSEDYQPADVLIDFLMVQYPKEIRFDNESITEKNLAKLMTEISQIKDSMEVYDFASGFGVLLAWLAKNKSVIVYAQDIKNINAAVSTMLLLIAGVRNINIYCGNSLDNPLTLNWNPPKKFDRVVSTLPFGLNAARINATPELGAAFEFGLGNSSKCDLVFAQHALASLKSDGIAVLLLPVGALFRGGREANLRKMMLEKNYIDSVIELPYGIIPSTPAKTAIVIFRKNKTSEDIYFADFSKETTRECFERYGKTGVRVVDAVLPEIVSIINSKKVIKGLSVFVPVNTVIDNEVNLTAGAYLSTVTNALPEITDIESLRSENANLLNRYMELESEFERIIDRF